MRIVLETLDGTKYEADGDAKTFGCLADRVAFEREFGTSAAVLGKVEQFVKRNPDGSTEVTDPDGLADALREEHVLFLAWRELRRKREDVPEWADVLEQAVALTLEGAPREAAPVDPPVAAVPPSDG